MMKNNYNLQDNNDRRELFNEYLVNRLPFVNFAKFDENINFLCNSGLSDEWLNVVAITIGELICPISLRSEIILSLFPFVRCYPFNFSFFLNTISSIPFLYVDLIVLMSAT